MSVCVRDFLLNEFILSNDSDGGWIELLLGCRCCSATHCLASVHSLTGGGFAANGGGCGCCCGGGDDDCL